MSKNANAANLLGHKVVVAYRSTQGGRQSVAGYVVENRTRGVRVADPDGERYLVVQGAPIGGKPDRRSDGGTVYTESGKSRFGPGREIGDWGYIKDLGYKVGGVGANHSLVTESELGDVLDVPGHGFSIVKAGNSRWEVDGGEHTRIRVRTYPTGVSLSNDDVDIDTVDELREVGKHPDYVPVDERPYQRLFNPMNTEKGQPVAVEGVLYHVSETATSSRSRHRKAPNGAVGLQTHRDFSAGKDRTRYPHLQIRFDGVVMTDEVDGETTTHYVDPDDIDLDPDVTADDGVCHHEAATDWSLSGVARTSFKVKVDIEATCPDCGAVISRAFEYDETEVREADDSRGRITEDRELLRESLGGAPTPIVDRSRVDGLKDD